MLYTVDTVDVAVDLTPGADRALELVLIAAGLRQAAPGRWRGELLAEAAEDLGRMLRPLGVEAGTSLL